MLRKNRLIGTHIVLGVHMEPSASLNKVFPPFHTFSSSSRSAICRHVHELRESREEKMNRPHPIAPSPIRDGDQAVYPAP